MVVFQDFILMFKENVTNVCMKVFAVVHTINTTITNMFIYEYVSHKLHPMFWQFYYY